MNNLTVSKNSPKIHQKKKKIDTPYTLVIYANRPWGGNYTTSIVQIQCNDDLAGDFTNETCFDMLQQISSEMKD